jgi:hypothetical protein
LPSVSPAFPEAAIRVSPVSHSLESRNPYQPPSASSLYTIQCSFCAQSHCAVVWPSRVNSHLICNDCVAYSIQLLDEANERGSQSRNT